MIIFIVVNGLINNIMDWTKIKAAAVDIDVDDNQMTQDLKNIPDELWDTGFDKTSETYWKTIWLTVNDVDVFKDFKTAKSIPHSDWRWDDRFEIPYIKNLVESLPVNTVGMIRAFILDGPLPMHIDSNDTTPDEITFKTALTIASQLELPMSMEDFEIPEKYIFFNDSISHGFPTATGTQVSIRVFGDFDYDAFTITKVYE
jgi:hypothetical protein